MIILKDQNNKDVFIEKEIWMAGKGQSLLTYDWSKAGKTRICINHTISLVPNPTGVIGLDYEFLDYLKTIDDGSFTVFRKNHHYMYDFKSMIIWSKEGIVTDLRFTCLAAVDLFYYYGVRTIHMVGFDSIDGDTSRPDKVLELLGNDKGNEQNYIRIADGLIECIKRHHDLKIIWEHRNERFCNSNNNR